MAPSSGDHVYFCSSWQDHLNALGLYLESSATREVTTTRQIATRVKRELLLEDGRILKDTGPKISTSVNEDTHTTNYHQTELAPADAKVLVSSRVVANPDGKVRESKDRKVLTRNITERVKETEENFHRGDTTHDHVNAIDLFLNTLKLDTRYCKDAEVI
ncbi:hypothetical protein MSG28_010221 [Choristoneura fumiferana]|uniref:Uncharacterized protein n=1 Tax=Choristoneura fumiferana TaxID=7141 RepID=A0ACC0KJL9_CHOFU|nr:hypothetical protein MSG28_010221 [Choristoneura fumiferana]